ncbi:MAG TPA: hypothetical protein PKZ97_07995, partial [Azospirillaceae bacterium]|nr:hypothetical protein [Azospirillaceae bacterium]
MNSAVFLQLLAAARDAPQDETAALRLAAFVVDSGAIHLSQAAAIFRHLLTLNPAGLGWAAWGRFLNARDDAAAVALLRRAAPQSD